ncbi:HAMP domain-containing sensor histidine kinase [Pilimelia columellifera]|uniref:histidine kinase n=1 Tax=Pilimelia columellifera subsp. columellifera TaxID=706583 RepID=A0ABN3MYM3_9ACTN
MVRRLLFTYLSFALLILLGLEVPFGYLYARSEEQREFARLEHDAEVLAVFLDAALRERQLGQVHLLARETAKRLKGQVDVVDARGEILSSTHPGQHRPGELAAAEDIRTALTGQGRVSTRTAESGGERFMSVAVPVRPGEPGQGAIRVTVPMATVTDRIYQVWWILTAAGLVVLAAAAAVAVALARWISRPVRELETTARQLADGAPPPPTPVTGPPELRRLAATVYATAARLQALTQAQRSFAGNASHQLRTPLAAIRLRLENLENDIDTSGRKHLHAAVRETDRLARMVQTLLDMARSGHPSSRREAINLRDAVTERVSLWQPLAVQRGVRIQHTNIADVSVSVVPGALDQILDNLLSNSIRHAPTDSPITISTRPTASPEDAAVELHIADSGPGLPPDQRDQAFSPFWRAPGAPKGGTGLGLSLVKQLAEASDGEVRLEPVEPTGIDATVTLPTGPVQSPV